MVEEDRRKVDAVNVPVLWQRDADEIEHCWENVHCAGNVARNGARGDPTRPPRQAGYTLAAFPCCAYDAVVNQGGGEGVAERMRKMIKATGERSYKGWREKETRRDM